VRTVKSKGIDLSFTFNFFKQNIEIFRLLLYTNFRNKCKHCLHFVCKILYKECDKMFELEENTKLLQELEAKLQDLGESL